MFNLLKQFAEAESGIHISLKADTVFTVGPINVTNSMIYGFICSVMLATILIISARKINFRPVKNAFYGAVEYLVDFIVSLVEGPLGSRAKAVKYAPFFGTFFVFIIFNNLMGLLPVVGPQIEVNGVPLLRPFTADLNGTIALAVIAIVGVQILSIREQGVKGHLKHYFTDKPWSPVNFFIGLLEVFGELTRIISLCLRLFLNTAVGEILIAVFTSMILTRGRTPLAVIPIFAFEMLVAGIQAYVFTILTSTYLGLAIAHADHGDSHDEPHVQDAISKKVEPVSA